MRTIGLIGGMSWESTVTYYQLINRAVKRELGGLHSAKIVLNSVDFQEIETLQHQDRWEESAELLPAAAQSLERAGADLFILCTNTMHKVAPSIESAVKIPFLHIADATAEQLKQDQCQKVALLGTRFTMEQDFYKQRLTEQHGIQILVPNPLQRQTIHDIIYCELCLGDIKEQSRIAVVDVIHDLTQQGAAATILGCTELALLVQTQHTSTPLYDTTQLHAEAAVQFALRA